MVNQVSNFQDFGMIQHAFQAVSRACRRLVRSLCALLWEMYLILFNDIPEQPSSVEILHRHVKFPPW